MLTIDIQGVPRRPLIKRFWEKLRVLSVDYTEALEIKRSIVTN